jgi:hypothetical protein
MPLTLKRKQNQTWFEAALDQAKSYNLAEEFLSAYQAYIKLGATEEDAVWSACYDWDILDYQHSEDETG